LAIGILTGQEAGIRILSGEEAGKEDPSWRGFTVKNGHFKKKLDNTHKNVQVTYLYL